MMKLIGDAKFDFPQIQFHGLPKQALRIALDILEFDSENPKKKIEKVEVWGNEFLSLFISKRPINVTYTFNNKDCLGLALLFADKFLEKRPEFDKPVCYAELLLTAYRIAKEWRGNREKLLKYLQNEADSRCCTMMIGFLQIVNDRFLVFSQPEINASYCNSPNHRIITTLNAPFKHSHS